MDALDDTIVAIATANGAAGLAVLRISGPAAVAVADAVFRARTPLAAAASHTLHHGWAVDGSDARIDEVVAALFRAPRSYTREDVVELSCHGGPLSAEAILAALVRAGARRARAGEFTLRAFLNGRVDLAQAEAVADVIEAETEAARALAVSQLGGELSREVRAVGGQVLDALAEIEARVDFAEDVGGVEVPDHVVVALERCVDRLATLLQGAAYGRALREGVRVPLVGRPNVGKSSLFNALLGEDRAIVTSFPGTTRDRVSEAIEIAGVRVTLTDTAGLRETTEPVEALGVGRAAEAIETSPLILWVVDGSSHWTDEDAGVAERLAGKHVVVALNKQDLGTCRSARDGAAAAASGGRVVAVSASRGDGVAELRDALAGTLVGPAAPGAPADSTSERRRDAATLRNGPALGAAVANPRHADALGRAKSALDRALDAGREGAPGEIVAIELREAGAALGEVTGDSIDADLLDRIFSRFCIGK